MRIQNDGMDLNRVKGELQAKGNAYRAISKIQEPHVHDAKISAGEVYREQLGFKDFILDEMAKLVDLGRKFVEIIAASQVVKDVAIAVNPDPEIDRLEKTAELARSVT